MKPLLLIFMLCGEPYFVVGHDDYGHFMGYYSAPAPLEIKKRLLEMYSNETTFEVRQELHHLIGGICA